MSPTRAAKPEKQKRPEGFRPDGSWGTDFDSGLTAFVWRMCQSRRTTASSPSEIAAAVRAAGYEYAFRRLEAWGADKRRQCLAWEFAPAGSSVESAVRLAGLGVDCEFLPDGRGVHRGKVIRRQMSPEEIRDSDRAAAEARRTLQGLIPLPERPTSDAAAPIPPPVTEYQEVHHGA